MNAHIIPLAWFRNRRKRGRHEPGPFVRPDGPPRPRYMDQPGVYLSPEVLRAAAEPRPVGSMVLAEELAAARSELAGKLPWWWHRHALLFKIEALDRDVWIEGLKEKWGLYCIGDPRPGDIEPAFLQTTPCDQMRWDNDGTLTITRTDGTEHVIEPEPPTGPLSVAGFLRGVDRIMEGVTTTRPPDPPDYDDDAEPSLDHDDELGWTDDELAELSDAPTSLDYLDDAPFGLVTYVDLVPAGGHPIEDLGGDDIEERLGGMIRAALTAEIVAILREQDHDSAKFMAQFRADCVATRVGVVRSLEKPC